VSLRVLERQRRHSPLSGSRKKRCGQLGYDVSYAVGNVLPALWGTVMVLLVN